MSSMRKEAFGIAVVGAAALLMVGLAKGQGPATPGQTATVNVDTAPPIRSTTRLVQVSVIVTDKKGEPVSGLSKQDFAVLDVGQNAGNRIFFGRSASGRGRNGAETASERVYESIRSEGAGPRSNHCGAVRFVEYVGAGPRLGAEPGDQFLKSLQPQTMWRCTV